MVVVLLTAETENAAVVLHQTAAENRPYFRSPVPLKVLVGI